MATENPDQRIYQQIEKSADFYEPAVYELLSFYHALENQQEPLDGQFIPMTTVQSRGAKDTKIFAVGLIPPSSNVTGRLLDRSASIQALATGNDADLPPEEFPDSRNDPFLVRPNAGLVESGSLSSKFGPRQLAGEEVKPHLGCDVAAPLGAEVRAASDGVVVDISPDGARSGYGNTIIVEHADGRMTLYAHLSSFGAGVHVGMKVAGGTVIGHVGQTSSPNPMPRPHLHFEVLTKRVEHNGKIVANKTTPQRLEPQRWLNSKGRTLASSKEADDREFQQPFEGDAGVNNGWASTGSANAGQAAKTTAKTANKDLNQTYLGRSFMEQQRTTIIALQAALDQMAKTPPLRLLVNPKSFKVSSEKIIADGSWGRNGPIIEHWGEGQDRIEASGTVAAFYSMDSYNANGPGLSRTARQFSTSYQNILAMWLIYKNNGGIWLQDPVSPNSRIQNLTVIGSVYLYYDEILYVGSFDNISLTESETTPYTLEYSFGFTVRSWYLLDHLDDPQYTYGQPNTPSLPTGTGQSPFAGGNNSQPSPDVALPLADDGLGPVSPNDFATGGG